MLCVYLFLCATLCLLRKLCGKINRKDRKEGTENTKTEC
jgi:hypothetical protein